MMSRRMAVWLIAALLAIDVAAAAWLWVLRTARHAPVAMATSTRLPVSHELAAALRERAAGNSKTRAR